MYVLSLKHADCTVNVIQSLGIVTVIFYSSMIMMSVCTLKTVRDNSIQENLYLYGRISEVIRLNITHGLKKIDGHSLAV